MGRPVRLKAPDVTYHITTRTNGGKLCLKARRDKKMLCNILHKILLKYEVVAYGFTAMDNHFHVIIHIKNHADISKIMCEFKTQYAKYFNRKYGLYGHFWGDRFRSTIIQDDRHALACLRYVDLNAVKAGLVPHPSQWPWGSFACYAYGQAQVALQIQPHPTYLALSTDEIERRKRYRAFVEGEDSLSDQLYGRLWRKRIFGTEQFVRQVMSRS